MSHDQRTQPVDLGFSTADATYPELTLRDQALTLRFADWREEVLVVSFGDTLGVRWQEAEYFVDDNDRYDGTYLVLRSEWLAEHDRQGLLVPGREFRHLKLNFNAAGILEILCGEVQVERPDSLES